jgi:hypothetical protein
MTHIFKKSQCMATYMGVWQATSPRRLFVLSFSGRGDLRLGYVLIIC